MVVGNCVVAKDDDDAGIELFAVTGGSKAQTISSVILAGEFNSGILFERLSSSSSSSADDLGADESVNKGFCFITLFFQIGSIMNVYFSFIVMMIILIFSFIFEGICYRGDWEILFSICLTYT